LIRPAIAVGRLAAIVAGPAGRDGEIELGKVDLLGRAAVDGNPELRARARGLAEDRDRFERGSCWCARRSARPLCEKPVAAAAPLMSPRDELDCARGCPWRSAAAAATGFSQSGRPIASRTNTILRLEAIAIFGKATRPSSQFRIFPSTAAHPADRPCRARFHRRAPAGPGDDRRQSADRDRGPDQREGLPCGGHGHAGDGPAGRPARTI